MRTRPAWLRRSMALGLLLALSSCATTQLQVPASFVATAEAWPVSGHSPRRAGEPVRFGPYSALELEDGAGRGWQVALDRFDLGGRTRDYAFTLVAVDQPSWT